MTFTAPATRIAVPEILPPDLLTGYDPKAAVVGLDGVTMGTTWHVKLALSSGHDAAPIAEAIQARLDGIVAQISHWEPTSLLCRFNHSAAGSWAGLPKDFSAIIASGLEIAERSNGAFDPALGRLTDAWSLGPNARGTPTDSEITEALTHSGWRHLAYDAENARLRQPGGIWLDLSGIAKGYAADTVAELLARLNIRHVLVEIGGECVGRGIRPDGEPWWVEAETPPGFALPQLRVALSHLAIATSGDYLRGAHTLDPATGRLPTHQTRAVSVLHSTCMAADAWASALSVLSPGEARGLAEREALAVRLLGRDGSEWLSSALARML